MPIQALARTQRAPSQTQARGERRQDAAADVGGARFGGVRVLMAPGLFGSGPDHWQSAWQRQHPRFTRVEQDDWTWPNLERWSRKVVETAIAANEPVVIVAHSFGCLATVRASVFQSNLIAGALLVAPADPARFRVEDKLPQTTIDFPTTVVASTNDPWMPFEKAQAWAERWGSNFVRLDGAGHINVKSGYSEWPLGLELLEQLCDRVNPQATRMPLLQLLH
jgi:predicted alpha/beta hydrolase family esterase